MSALSFLLLWKENKERDTLSIQSLYLLINHLFVLVGLQKIPYIYCTVKRINGSKESVVLCMKQIFWWQKRSLGSLFTDSTIRSIIQQSFNLKKSTFQEHSVSRNGASILDVFFSRFYFILFLFYLFNMKIKYDVRIYSLTSQASINNTSAEENRQLRPSPRPKRTHHHHRLAEVVPRRRNAYSAHWLIL